MNVRETINHYKNPEIQNQLENGCPLPDDIISSIIEETWDHSVLRRNHVKKIMIIEEIIRKKRQNNQSQSIEFLLKAELNKDSYFNSVPKAEITCCLLSILSPFALILLKCFGFFENWLYVLLGFIPIITWVGNKTLKWGFRTCDQAFFNHEEYEADVIKCFWALQDYWVGDEKVEELSKFNTVKYQELSTEQSTRRDKELQVALWSAGILTAFSYFAKSDLDPNIRIAISSIAVPLILLVYAYVYRFLVSTHQIYYKGLVFQFLEISLKNQKYELTLNKKNSLGFPPEIYRLLKGPDQIWGTYMYRVLLLLVTTLSSLLLIGWAISGDSETQKHSIDNQNNTIVMEQSRIIAHEKVK